MSSSFDNGIHATSHAFIICALGALGCTSTVRATNLEETVVACIHLDYIIQ